MRFKVEILLAFVFGGLSLTGLIIPSLGYLFLVLSALVCVDIIISKMGYELSIIPLRLEHNKGIKSKAVASKDKLDKVTLVAKAIEDAKQITPNGKDVIVYLTASGVLNEIYLNNQPILIQELKSILAKLQDDEKVIKLKSFPEWVQPPKGRTFTLDMWDELKKRTLNPQSFYFVIDILNTFGKWYKENV